MRRSDQYMDRVSSRDIVKLQRLLRKAKRMQRESDKSWERLKRFLLADQTKSRGIDERSKRRKR